MSSKAPTTDGSPAPVAPLDQQARDRISQDLGATLFVEAGAGSGKTTALVQRVLQLVITGTAELSQIAAITFTEKAGAELRDRIRRQLEEYAAEATAAPEVAQRCQKATDQLDGAAIGTLHSFAQRMLSENPVEAGLPPRVEVLDEVSSNLAFESRWERFVDLLLAEPEMEQPILILEATGIRFEALRYLAVAFDENWDLVHARIADTAVPLPQLRPKLDALVERIRSVCRLRSDCSDRSDKLCIYLDGLADCTTALTAITDDLELLAELAGNGTRGELKFKPGGVGSAANWKGATSKAEVVAAVRALSDDVDRTVAEIAEAAAKVLARELRSHTLEAVASRREAGLLTFHDLLVMARELLTHPEHGAAVRERLHNRYQRLLLDEFQDTDPIQVELAVRIAAADPVSDEAGNLPWNEVAVSPGHLFVVGDPKQSIYRFRRADISVFLAARERFGGEAAENVVTLATNFRSNSTVIDHVNAIFQHLIGDGAGGAQDPDLPIPSQAAYSPLNAHRHSAPVGPAVAVIVGAPVDFGEGAATPSAAQLREIEAREVAATVATVISEQWSVGDSAERRPARLGDITILLPARTSLPFLEDALDKLNIAYRAESSSLVYSSRTVRDLLMTLRAADDPTDHLAIVSALRSPLFSCGDDDLVRFKVHQGGRWDYLSPQPESVEAGPVTDGLTYLRRIHDDRHWSSPAEILDRIARDRRLFELGFAEGRTRDVWRRLRYVIDQARAWSEVASGGTREYLRWVAHQTAEGARVAEAVLPETDDDAVRIMTIHASKGLEFPVTIVSGMSTVPSSRTAPAQVVFPPGGSVGYKLGKKVSTDVYEDWKPIDEQMSYHERIRLLYVACTRAEDHLVLSLCRKTRTKAPHPHSRTNAELLVDGLGETLDAVPAAVLQDPAVPRIKAAATAPAPLPYATWRAELDAALLTGSRPTTVAATALTDDGGPDATAPDPALTASTSEAPDLAAGLHKRPRDLDLPPWLKGRYGTAVGRAVHGALQTIPLATGEGLDAAVGAQCEAEAISDRESDVTKLVKLALESPTVQEAAGAPHWREVYACTPVGGRLLEGYIDLLYRVPEGLVIADYKTSGSSDPSDLAERVEGYRLQGAAYALAVGATTGEQVVRVVFIFLTPSGAIEIELGDLAGAVADVERLVSQGEELVLA